jgi:hypothetical protein
VNRGPEFAHYLIDAARDGWYEQAVEQVLATKPSRRAALNVLPRLTKALAAEIDRGADLATVLRNGSGGGGWLPRTAAGGRSEATGHQADHGLLDHRLGVRGQPLIVAAHAAVAGDPGVRVRSLPRPRVLSTGTSGSISAHCASVGSDG